MDDRYARHFALKEVGQEGQKKLLSSKVLIVGAGGLGSAAALYLAAAGVGTLGICDPDSVEEVNLQRQIIHTTARVGMNKAISAKESVQALNPEVFVDPYTFALTTENIIDIISKYDFILDCVDAFGSKFLINDACVLMQKPFTHAGVVRFSGQVMTYIPGRGPCLRCLLKEVPPADASPLCKQVGVLGAAVGTIGCIQAAEAVKCLLGIGEPLCGKVLSFDALKMECRVTKIKGADKDCAVCGGKPFSLAAHVHEYGE